jgi:hypothetical protein
MRLIAGGSSRIRGRVVPGVLLALGVCPPLASAAPFVLTQTDTYTATWVTATDEIIMEGSDGDSTDEPGERITSSADADCPEDQYCAVFPHDTPSQTASARTDYGLNGVYAHGRHYSVGGVSSHVDSAEARSTWSDEWTLGGNVTGAQDFMLAVQADGHWSGSGAFALQVLIVDGGLQIGDDGLPVGTIARGVMTNACDWGFDSGITLDGCNLPPLPLPPSSAFVDVNPDGDGHGNFDHALVVAAPWVTGRTYTVIVSLFAATGPSDGSLLDADSTARVSQVLVPAGGTLGSAAGALANYHVSEVPIPAVAWLFGAALVCAARVARRRPTSSARP